MKKEMKKKLEGKRRTLFMIGMALATAVTLAAFEYRTSYEILSTNGGTFVDNWAEEEVMPVRIEKPEIKPIPEPKNKLPKSDQIKVIDNNTPIEPKADDPIVIIDETDIKNFDLPDEKVDDPPLIVDIPGVMATFPGRAGAWQSYLANNVKYPESAKRIGAQGNVYVSFVVMKDGTVTDVKLLRGIHPDCDKEAVEAIMNSPKWQAALQRNIPVNVRMKAAVRFRLKG